jgi:hypothetical protein
MFIMLPCSVRAAISGFQISQEGAMVGLHSTFPPIFLLSLRPDREPGTRYDTWRYGDDKSLEGNHIGAIFG